MGCTNSKLNDLPAVSLCRHRCFHLSDAIHHRYVFAEAHTAYLHSLTAVGLSLHRFFAAVPPPPELNLLPHQKIDTKSPNRRSHCGSHLHFHSNDDDVSPPDSPLHHHHHCGNSSPVHNYAGDETLGSYSVGGFMNMKLNNNNMNISYMKKVDAPSILYEQRPYSADTVYMETGESSYPNYINENPNFNSHNNYFFGASLSKPPPSPLSPPRGSGWDFLYPFENFESFYPPHTRPSIHDSKEVREDEGIPDLEKEHEVVKEVYANQKIPQNKNSKEYTENHKELKEIDLGLVYNNRPIVENGLVEYEIHEVDKKVVSGGDTAADGGDVAVFKALGDLDVVREIQIQFERASELGNELGEILEVGIFPYKKSAADKVSTKLLQVITPSLPRHSNADSSALDKSDPLYLGADQYSGMRSGNLSATLQKLYLWEKKLYEEVKVEEKMRALHEKKSRKLKRLDERGAETHKIDATRALVRSLSTKIRIAIQVVDKISVTINKLRDEELWSQLNEVVQGLARMWKTMYECHLIQSQAIAQAKRLDSASMHKKNSDAELEDTIELERELLNWTLRFSCWVSAQKGFVQSLNNWLIKSILYVPEQTPDGTVPFSPSKLGAPPIFIICNQWAQTMERISEREVVDSMRDFASSVLHLWERDKLKMRQRMMSKKDTEKRVKNLEREDQKIHKEIEALDMAMETFVSNNFKAYEELLQRIEEDRGERVARENQKES